MVIEHVGIPNFSTQVGIPSLGSAHLGSSFVDHGQMFFYVCLESLRKAQIMAVVTRLVSHHVGEFRCIWQDLWQREDKPLHRKMRGEVFVVIFLSLPTKVQFGIQTKPFFFFFGKGRKRKCFLLRKWYLSSPQSIYSGRTMRPKDVDTTFLVSSSSRNRMVEITLK